MSAITKTAADAQHDQSGQYYALQPEYNWQFLLESSLAKRLGASAALCLPGFESLQYFAIQSLLRSGQNLLVCGDIAPDWELFLRQRLHPQGIGAKHSYTGDSTGYEAKLDPETRLLYWFAPATITPKTLADLAVLHKLSRHYRLPLLADLRQCQDRNFDPFAHGCTLQLGGGQPQGFAWLAETDSFSWNSGYFSAIAQQEEQAGLCAYIRKQWLSFLHLGLGDTQASEAWQQLLSGRLVLTSKTATA